MLLGSTCSRMLTLMFMDQYITTEYLEGEDVE
jgi:hypothetical protein